MLTIISPAKTLDFDQKINTADYSMPELLEKSQLLVSRLKKYKPAQLSKLMSISPKLGQLNYERFQEWGIPFTIENAKQAVAVFKGDVYIGLDIDQFTESDLIYAQKHLRILSGLHGLLKPLDLVRPYRLEMGTKLKYRRKNNLYEFWGDDITKSIQSDLNGTEEPTIVNLASNEYFKSVNLKKLNARIVTPVFKDFKNGKYKFLSFYGKKARGMMARYILKNKVGSVEKLKLFEEDGYYYNENLSDGDVFVFTRG